MTTTVTKEGTKRRNPAEQHSQAKKVFLSVLNDINTQHASGQMPAPSFSDIKRINDASWPLRSRAVWGPNSGLALAEQLLCLCPLPAGNTAAA
jgi:hypothetical protein